MTFFQPQKRVFGELKGKERIVNTTGKLGVFGLLLSSYYNATQYHKKGFFGVFTRTGYLIPYYGNPPLNHCLATLGATFSISLTGLEEFRKKDDTLNYTMAGFLTGMVAGARTLKLPNMFLGGLVLAVPMAAVKFFGDPLAPAPYIKENAIERIRRQRSFMASKEEIAKLKQDFYDYYEPIPKSEFMK